MNDKERIEMALRRARAAGHGLRDSDCYHASCIACAMVDDLEED